MLCPVDAASWRVILSWLEKWQILCYSLGGPSSEWALVSSLEGALNLSQSERDARGSSQRQLTISAWNRRLSLRLGGVCWGSDTRPSNRLPRQP